MTMTGEKIKIELQRRIQHAQELLEEARDHRISKCETLKSRDEVACESVVVALESFDYWLSTENGWGF